MAVMRMEIKSRQPFAGGQSFGAVGPYEILDGVARFAVSPEHPANAPITDLKLAPRDVQGRVTWSADFRILKPLNPQRGSGRLLFDVLNRGGMRALTYFNLAPNNRNASAPPQPGDGLLNRLGYSVAWCGWQHDLPKAPGLLGMQVPSAPVTGKVCVTFQNNTRTQTQLLADRAHQAYPANRLNDPDAVLTARENEDAPEQVIPRGQWQFARAQGGQAVPDAAHIYMEAGFEPGRVYEVTYQTTGAPVVGLGLLGARDLVAFLRHETADNPCAGSLRHAYAFGASQSGRFLRHLLYLGLNEDEAGRPIFEGLLPHIAGARRGEFNVRFGQPSNTGKRSVNNLFPFSDVPQTDPETSLTAGWLDVLAQQGKLPKIILTNTSCEYWGGHAALAHIDSAGRRDLTVGDNLRIYALAGTQHASGTFPPADRNEDARGQQLFNWVDYRPLLRASLVNLDAWVTQGKQPPANRHPRLSDNTLVPPQTLAAPYEAIPGVNFPAHFKRLNRLDFGGSETVPTVIPPGVGKPYPNLVSPVDGDGNETAGLRLPDLTVPIATHTGWNLRHPDTGGLGQVMTNTGSTIPFAATRAERQASGDPRPSVEERYASREGYLSRVRQAAAELAAQGYLLNEDIQTLVDHAAARYDVIVSPARVLQAADN